MFEGLKSLLGRGGNEDVEELAQAGAVIVDVRSPAEFASGHIPGSVNVPVDRIPAGLSKYAKEKPVIVCCASGMRSAMAKRSLQAAGYARVANGGPWQSLLGRLGK